MSIEGITYSTLTHRGMTFAIAWHDKCCVPIGLLWGQWHYRDTEGDAVPIRFDLMGCYTLLPWRRHGIMTGLIVQLFDTATCECICTDSGSEDGGMKLVKGMGFKMCENTGTWYLKRTNEQ